MELTSFTIIECCLMTFIFILPSQGKQEHTIVQDFAHGIHRRDIQNITSKRNASNIVDISMFTDSSAPGNVFSVYVDDTISRLIIEVKVERSTPVIILLKPSGLLGPHPIINGAASGGTVTATIDVAITAADYGIWKLNKLDANFWNVNIQGESSLDFTYQFLTGSFIQVPLTGDPVQGETYKTVLTVADFTKAYTVDVVYMFLIEKYTPANLMIPTDKGNGTYEVAKLKMIDRDFMIGINGKDNSGHFFRRIKTIKPIALLLLVPSLNDSSVKLYENTKLELVFYVTNKLSKDQDIDIKIQDTQGFAETPTIISLTLTPGQNYTGKFVIIGGLFGATTNVTIKAGPYISGRRTSGPSIMRQFTVDRHLTTTSTDLPKMTDIPTMSFSNSSFVPNSKGGLISANSILAVSTTSASSKPVTDVSKITTSDVLTSSTPQLETSTISINDASSARSMFYTSAVPYTKTIMPHIVDISMFTDSSAPGKAYSVYVDDTITRLIIEVKVERSSPVIMLAKPPGLPGPHPKLNGTASAGTVTATIDVAITSADYGIWKLNKLDANTWNVKIQGESSLDFTYQFLSGKFIQVPLTGDPVQGETYKTVLTVADFTKAKSVDIVQLFVIEKSTLVDFIPPTDKGNGKYEIAQLKMLDKDFMIGISGKDNSGHFFRRIKTIKPIALLLSVPSLNDSSVKLYEKTKLELVFYVTNEISKDQDIDVRIQDTHGFAERPTVISVTLTPGQNYTGKFVITGGLFGATTNVTITAKPYIRGQETYGPSVMRQFSVERNLTTTSTDLPKMTDIPTMPFSNSSFIPNSKGISSSIPVTDISKKTTSGVLTSSNPKASTIATNDASSARFYTSDVPYTKTITPHIVDISMFTDNSGPGKSYSVYVDDTMTRLIVEVKVERSSPVIMLAKPSGLPGPLRRLNGTASAGTVTATIDVAITSADYGIWKLTKLDANTWNVKIQGKSSLDFKYQFLSGSFIQYPLTGGPVQGETYKTVLTVADFTKAKSVDVVQLFIIERLTPVNMMFPIDKGTGKYELAKLKMLDKDFMIGINGKDNSGHFFRRIKTIKPIALSLSVPSFNDSSVKLYENTKLELVFYVINELSKDQEIDVRIQDTQGFAQSPTIISETLTPGQNYTGKFVITGGLFGVTTDVTITVNPYIPGKKTDGPSIMRQFTVEKNLSTTLGAPLTATTVASLEPTRVSSNIPLVTSSTDIKHTQKSTPSSYNTVNVTFEGKTKVSDSSPDKNGLFAIFSALVFNNGKTIVSNPKSNHMTFSERFELNWP